MVAVVRGDLNEVSVGPCTREEKRAKSIGRFFGTFRILSEERIEAAETEGIGMKSGLVSEGNMEMGPAGLEPATKRL